MNLTTTRTFLTAIIACLLPCCAHAATVSFGSGPNQFNMEFVEIGSPDNVNDYPQELGMVGYTYSLGKYEVSRDMITKANAEGSLGITLDDMSSFGGNGANRPATGISWNEAARFVNWLNTSQGFAPAYKFITSGVNDNIELWTPADALDYDPANKYRSLRAHYVLPNINEWYKAAFYNSGTSTYFDYPTGSNTAPIAVTSGTTAGTAVYDQPYFGSGPADITNAGGLSPFGIMGLGGNVVDWNETEFDRVNDRPVNNRLSLICMVVLHGLGTVRHSGEGITRE